jgi:NADPH-dependent 2,4-dienoyl-CoA reductase/sulfur reductase-like enzyme
LSTATRPVEPTWMPSACCACATFGRSPVISGLIAQPEDLISYPPDFFRQRRRLDLRLHARALDLDPDQRTLGVRQAGRTERLEYSALVIAAGGTPNVPAHRC